MSNTDPIVDISEERTKSRVDTMLAIGRYIRALGNFEKASKEFNEACNQVRKVVNPNSRFLTKHDYDYYIVEVDADGSFNVEEIEVL